MRRRLVLALSGLLLTGCAHPGRAPEGQLVSETGTVRHIDLAGGFYGILGDSGKHYDPVNLDPAFRQNGLRIRFTGKPLQGVLTMRMWGRPIKLTEIQRITPTAK